MTPASSRKIKRQLFTPNEKALQQRLEEQVRGRRAIYPIIGARRTAEARVAVSVTRLSWTQPHIQLRAFMNIHIYTQKTLSERKEMAARESVLTEMQTIVKVRKGRGTAVCYACT